MANQIRPTLQKTQLELRVERVYSSIREERCRIDLLDYLSHLHGRIQDDNVIAYVAESEDFFRKLGLTRTLAPTAFLICVKRIPDSKKYEMWQAKYLKSGDAWYLGCPPANLNSKNMPPHQFYSGDLEYKAFELLVKTAQGIKK